VLLALAAPSSAAGWAHGVEPTPPVNAASNSDVSVGGASCASACNWVSCASAGNCSAVGGYTDNSGHRQGMLLDEHSGRWARGVEARLPANAAPNLGGAPAVSCASAGNCGAVGTYVNTSGHLQLMFLAEFSGRWARGLGAPLPANAATNPKDTAVAINSVSCPSPGNCTAVGFYSGNDDQDHGLLLTKSSRPT
jgi:hypothetical protein